MNCIRTESDLVTYLLTYLFTYFTPVTDISNDPVPPPPSVVEPFSPNNLGSSGGLCNVYDFGSESLIKMM